MQVQATRLARERVRRGIQQKEFAALLGLSPSTLSTVENGHRAPWPKLRADAARLLGLDEDELFPLDDRSAWRGTASEALAIRGATAVSTLAIPEKRTPGLTGREGVRDENRRGKPS